MACDSIGCETCRNKVLEPGDSVRCQDCGTCRYELLNPIELPSQFEEDMQFITDKLIKLLHKKNKKYGGAYKIIDNDVTTFAIAVRIHDKVSRLLNMAIGNVRKADTNSTNNIVNELADIAGYCILGIDNLVLEDNLEFNNEDEEYTDEEE